MESDQQNQPGAESEITELAHPAEHPDATLKRKVLFRRWHPGVLAGVALALLVGAIVEQGLANQSSGRHLTTYSVAASSPTVTQPTLPPSTATAGGGSTPSVRATSTPISSAPVYVPGPYAPPHAKFVITGIQIAGSPTSYDCTAETEAFVFTASIDTNATVTGFVVNGSFAGSGPAGPIGDASGTFAQYQIAPKETQTTVRYTVVLNASDNNGQYWMQFNASTSSGSVAYSNVAIITKGQSC